MLGISWAATAWKELTWAPARPREQARAGAGCSATAPIPGARPLRAAPSDRWEGATPGGRAWNCSWFSASLRKCPSDAHRNSARLRCQGTRHSTHTHTHTLAHTLAHTHTYTTHHTHTPVMAELSSNGWEKGLRRSSEGLMPPSSTHFC